MSQPESPEITASIERARQGVENLFYDINLPPRDQHYLIGQEGVEFVLLGNEASSQNIQNLYLGIKPAVLIDDEFSIRLLETNVLSRFQARPRIDGGDIIFSSQLVQETINKNLTYFTNQTGVMTIREAIGELSSNSQEHDFNGLIREGLLLGFPLENCIEYATFHALHDDFFPRLYSLEKDQALPAQDLKILKQYLNLTEDIEESQDIELFNSELKRFLKTYTPELTEEDMDYLIHQRNSNIYGLFFRIDSRQESIKSFTERIQDIQELSGLFEAIQEYKENRKPELRRAA
jgi:hypothetical protein